MTTRPAQRAVEARAPGNMNPNPVEFTKELKLRCTSVVQSEAAKKEVRPLFAEHCRPAR
jgi:hypothetical protein